jgi:hypothetical protein
MALTRKILLAAKIESTYGTDPVPTGALNFIQCGSIEITPIESDNVQSAALQGFIGNSTRGTIVANKRVSVTFDVELQARAPQVLLQLLGRCLRQPVYLRLLFQAQALLTLVSAAALTVPRFIVFMTTLAIKLQALVGLLALT